MPSSSSSSLSPQSSRQKQENEATAPTTPTSSPYADYSSMRSPAAATTTTTPRGEGQQTNSSYGGRPTMSSSPYYSSPAGVTGGYSSPYPSYSARGAPGSAHSHASAGSTYASPYHQHQQPMTATTPPINNTNGSRVSPYPGSGSPYYVTNATSPYASSAAAAAAIGSPYGSTATTSSYDNDGNGHSSPSGGGMGLRRRVGRPSRDPSSGAGHSDYYDDKYSKKGQVVQKLDFLFPKVDKEFTVQTKSGGVASLIAYGLLVLFMVAETWTFFAANASQREHISVDTALGKRMRVNINITFPSLACEDLHVDSIDVAGDSQLDVEDTLKKKQLHANGKPMSKQEIEVETNAHKKKQEEKERILKEALPPDYCGPCFGAQEEDGQCCQTCDEVLAAYEKKRWKTDLLKYTSEQCIREGRDKAEPKKMTKGQGCNLSGYMTVNRVSGNFHIAMGEGIERDGRHIHTFLPNDAPNFNASHIIHQLSFGPSDGTDPPLNGVTKIVTEDTGTTGLFQYFIKIVPTTYKGEDSLPDHARSAILQDSLALPSLDPSVEAAAAAAAGSGTAKQEFELETNRYFFTERYRPLMTELLESHQFETVEDEDDNDGSSSDPLAHTHAGHGGGHSNEEHHKVQNSVLPGVFFIYEIYPFCVEISKTTVPITHLIIRLLATIGGVFTMVRWADSYLYERAKQRS